VRAPPATHRNYCANDGTKSTGYLLSGRIPVPLPTLLHPFNGLFSRTAWVSRYQKGKTSLDLNEARDDGFWGCSGISWTICKQSAPHSRQITNTTDNHTNTSSLNFYRPDAPPDAQPTMSKH